MPTCRPGTWTALAASTRKRPVSCRSPSITATRRQYPGDYSDALTERDQNDTQGPGTGGCSGAGRTDKYCTLGGIVGARVTATCNRPRSHHRPAPAQRVFDHVELVRRRALSDFRGEILDVALPAILRSIQEEVPGGDAIGQAVVPADDEFRHVIPRRNEASVRADGCISTERIASLTGRRDADLRCCPAARTRATDARSAEARTRMGEQ